MNTNYDINVTNHTLSSCAGLVPLDYDLEKIIDLISSANNGILSNTLPPKKSVNFSLTFCRTEFCPVLL